MSQAQLSPPRGILFRRSFPAEHIKHVALWLTLFGSCIAFIEPSPFEIMFFVMTIVFFATRITFARMMTPLLVLIVLYNLGGLIALIPFTHDGKAVMFIAISIYMAFIAVLLAAVVLEDSDRRMKIVENGWIAAGVVASIAGIMGYFNIAGTGAIFTLNDRASGTFKDPNVLGTYLLFPFVALIVGLVTGNRQLSLFRLGALVLVAAAIFLSFSRGAWGIAGLSAMLAIALAFIVTRSNLQRARMVAMTLAGAALLTAMLMVVLSIDEVRDLFLQRFSLQQSYDVQSGGRFDNQLKSIPMLLERINGFGPYQFRYFFPEDPHNVYVNGFASYGWLGGLAYLALTLVTLVIGWRGVFLRSSVQMHLITAWSCLFMLILQGFTIDTDHWRHYYILLGLVWGLYGVAEREHRTVSHPAPKSGLVFR